ncbi:hypothetical protein [uncultured Mediterranean phage uvMED]|nr:hypothetical protein [uncultured Mediterranean phage uvMED]BAR19737.1 hypothetical protein [uncultured Mediterranean phage uvMED]BAR19828.1 hypothetical protein [uncultured Mediterranean phage uvMED]
MAKKPVWKSKNPKPKSKRRKMTDKEEAKAKRTAKAAGRPYPNMVDNIRAMKKKKRKK